MIGTTFDTSRGADGILRAGIRKRGQKDAIYRTGDELQAIIESGDGDEDVELALRMIRQIEAARRANKKASPQAGD